MSLRKIPFRLILPLLMLAFVGVSTAAGADLREGWGRWWLPPDRSKHGHAIDSLFVVTFWITMVTWIAVQIAMIWFLIKYRYRPERKKAIFTHGNTRLEMAWTLAPAVILAGLAVANKGAWDALRFPGEEARRDKATILVIGQQFKWNVIYPGPDGKLGRYLIFPKPTDQRWPGGTKFANVAGPAFLKYEEAVKQINNYASTVNPLGKDFNDPDGKDDNFSQQPGREINIPANRPTEVQLSSKDVIHSFFLPNHRVKLDAVPGMRGKILFTATMTTKEREAVSRKTYNVDELITLFTAVPTTEMTVVVTKDSPGAVKDPKREQYLYQDKSEKPKTIVRDSGLLTKDNLAKLKEVGIKEILAYEPGYWDLVCEELCGMGHSTMQGKVVVLGPEEYRTQFEGGKSLNPPSTKPSNIAAAQ